MKYTRRYDQRGTIQITQFDNGVNVGWCSLKLVDGLVYLIHIETYNQYRRRGYGAMLIRYIKRRYDRQIVGNWKNQDARLFFVNVGAKFGQGRSFKIGKR